MTEIKTELSPAQAAAVAHARALIAIPTADDEALAVFCGHDDLGTVYAAAFAEAKATIGALLYVIGGLTGDGAQSFAVPVIDYDETHFCTDYELCRHCGQCHACCGCF
jgi:hypothetical protein